jgi:hypothetical protein
MANRQALARRHSQVVLIFYISTLNRIYARVVMERYKILRVHLQEGRNIIRDE